MDSNKLIAIGVILAACFVTQHSQAQQLSFSLPDLDGTPVKLEKQSDRQFTVVCFLGTECPLAKLYASRLGELSSKFTELQFIAVCSNRHDSLDDLLAFRKQHKIEFPLVKDRNNIVADQFEAQRTPEVFLLDQDLQIRYRGRIDDQYQPGIARSKPHRHDLETAINQCLANEPVSIPSTEPEGCLIGRVKDIANPDSKITYANQISRLLQNHCSECHREGQIGPMELVDYEEVVGWADMIVEVINNNRMPPWHADPLHGQFVNERRMTSEEKQMVRDWVDAGTPQGDLAQLPPRKQFAKSTQWRLPKAPDLVVPMRSRPFTVPPTGTVEYQYFVVDPGLKEDKWITAAEILPGDRSVLHHSIVFVRPPDGTDIRGIGWLAAFVPGQSAPTFDPRFGRKIPAGSRFVFQQHYTPNGKQASDITRIGLVFGDEQEIENEVFTLLAMDQEFVIPPGADDYRVSATFPWLPKRGNLMGFSPHMHYRGKSFELSAQIKQADEVDASKETLLRVPNYDFNWQPIYQLQDPIPLATIKSLEFVAAFDNSSNNPANPDPTKAVAWGDQTGEEMAVAFAIVSQPREINSLDKPVQTAEQKLKWENHQKFIQQKVNAFVDDYFKRFDSNGDGQISRKSEYPRSIRTHGAWSIDQDQDQIVTREEVIRAARSHFFREYPIDSFLD